MRLKEYYLEKFENAKKQLSELSTKLDSEFETLDEINTEFGEYESTQSESKILDNVTDLIAMAVEEVAICVDKMDYIINELKG